MICLNTCISVKPSSVMGKASSQVGKTLPGAFENSQYQIQLLDLVNRDLQGCRIDQCLQMVTSVQESFEKRQKYIDVLKWWAVQAISWLLQFLKRINFKLQLSEKEFFCTDFSGKYILSNISNIPGLRKSGTPAEVDIPAPVITMMFFTSRLFI